MDRRDFVKSVGLVSSVTAISGCLGNSDTYHTPSNESETESDLIYDYDEDAFEIETAFIGRNAPDKVGVSVQIRNTNFEGTKIPVKCEVINKNGSIVFTEPVLIVGVSGGTTTLATTWFTATEEEFTMDLYPRVRIREEPPNNN